MSLPWVEINGKAIEPVELDGIVVTHSDYEPTALRCPVCSYNFSHIRSVYTALGCDPHEGGVPYEGTQARGTVSSRRDCLVITVDGECGHVWEIRIQQHKGNNNVSTRYIPEVRIDPDGDWPT